MKVYRFEGDPDYVVARCCDLRVYDELIAIDRGAVSQEFVGEVDVEFDFRLPEDEGVITDCPYMSPGNSLLLSDRAADILRPLLTEAGRLIPVRARGRGTYTLFVCTKKIDALDTAKTELCDQDLFMPWDIRRYAFRPEVLEGVGIFQDSGLFSRLFATDRLLEAMAGHRLTGFRIRPVWSSETGPLATLEGSGAEFIRYPPGYGTTLREKRQAMRDYIAGRR